MKHTPGPWMIGLTPHYLQMGQEGVPLTIRSPHNTEEIATVWTCCLPTEANARLIAAAPELLEAIEKVKEYQSEAMNGDLKKTKQMFFELVKVVDSVIAKAKGL